MPQNSNTTAQAVLAELDASEASSIHRLVDWLKIPSISTDPAYKEHCRRAGQWAVDQLKELGFADARLVETGNGAGHPVVLAHSQGSGPRILFYGHYDVQPCDPEDLWESKPFEPTIKNAAGKTCTVEEAARENLASWKDPAREKPGARIIARGAVDDKGQVQCFLEACRAWKKATGHPTAGVPYTVVLEGEEESGSKHLEQFVLDHAQELKACAVCLISDTGMIGRGMPAITYGVRGLAYTEIRLHAADQDLHSGLWGGRCPNPITELARVLAQLHDKDRRITIQGFYDSVRPLAQVERDAWRELSATTGLTAASTLAKIGLSPNADVGEAGYTFIEREWARPTAEINGIWGGYTGAGAKTVIPAYATAKVSFRLVADQKPEVVTEQFFAWLKDRTPQGCRWELTDLHGGYGVTVPTDSPLLAKAANALERAIGRRPAMIKSGGSIPVAGMLKSRLGLDTIFMGFGLDDDRVHSPNEKFELSCYALGKRAHALFMAELAG
jgi:acetylornithine deacetylase/succinyl-diaminopimelate desuccinylase-like protein